MAKYSDKNVILEPLLHSDVPGMKFVKNEENSPLFWKSEDRMYNISEIQTSKSFSIIFYLVFNLSFSPIIGPFVTFMKKKN